MKDLIVTTADFLSKNFRSFSDDILKFAKINFNNEFRIPFIVKEGRTKGTQFKFIRENSIAEFFLDGKKLFSVEEPGKKYLEFLRGKWFEAACYIKLKRINKFDKIESNLRLDWKDDILKINKDKNEFDIIAMKGTYPHLFECKSGGVKSEAIDKLVSLRKNYLKRYSSIYIVAFYEPRRDILERMEDNGIKFIPYNQIENAFVHLDESLANLD